MAKNKRIYYAAQQVGIKADGDSGQFTAIHGVQSVSMTTNFNLNQVFELGQLEIYENIEDIPDVEISLTKVLDGYPLIYHLATMGATTTSPTLAGRSNSKCLFGLAIFSDTADAAEGTPNNVVQCSGMFVNSVTYNFPADDNFTEEVTLVGNDKVWANTLGYGDPLGTLPTPSFDGKFSSTVDDGPQGAGGVNRRENFVFDSTLDPYCTKLPPEVVGIGLDGYNVKDVNGEYGAHINSITASVDMGRETIDELGRFAPYHRFLTFPTEVTCEIEVTSISGDMVSATEAGIYTTETDQCAIVGNLKNRTIRLATCEGTLIYLGAKNKLQSVNYGGGDTGGGNATVTYTYSNFNSFTVTHSGDPHENGNAWWRNAESSGYA